MSTFNWLHLSDFHVGKDNYAQRRLFSSLLQHIQNRLREGCKPEFVFITGDIANGGKAAEYEEFVGEFLTPLSTALAQAGCASRIFMVPGNHDVDRDCAPLVSREVVFKRSPNFLDPTPEALKSRREILPRFKAFMENDVTWSGSHWIASEQGSFAQQIKVERISVGIVGLNTAWHSEGGDCENLRAGVGMLEASIEALHESDLIIVLGHHPLTWLSEDDARPIRSVLGKARALYLHGHLHQNATQINDGAGRLFRSIQAGASFQSRTDEKWENRIYWGGYDDEMERVSLEPWTWVANEREWRLDGRSLPEASRGPGTSTWYFQLPATVTASPRAAASAPSRLPDGWRMYTLHEIERTHASDADLLRYFDGGHPSISIAASTKVPLRDVVVEQLRRLHEVDGRLKALLVVGGGGEGKTTAGYQVAVELLRRGAADVILEREDIEAQFDVSRVSLDPTSRVALLINDAHTALPSLPEKLALLAKSVASVVGVFVSRETDWETKLSADRTVWPTYVPLVKVVMHGLTAGDAQAVIAAWERFGDQGLGALHELHASQRAATLLGHAQQEAKQKEGAFLGALLRARLGAFMSEHVRGIVRSFHARGEGAKRKILDAFSYIAFVHNEGLDILTDQILAGVMQLDMRDLKRAFLLPMREETVVGMHGHLVATRHREIARCACEVLTKEYGHDRAEAFTGLVLAANELAAKNIFVQYLAYWRFDIVEHFLDQGDFATAQRLAGTLFSCDETNPFFATKYSVALRKGGEAESACEFMRRAATTVILGRNGTRSFYIEWAAACLAASFPRTAAWLASVALADFPGAAMDGGNAELAMQQLDIALEMAGMEPLMLAGMTGNPSFDPIILSTAARLAWEKREIEGATAVPEGGALEFRSFQALGRRQRLNRRPD